MNRRSFLAALPLVPAALVARLRPKAEAETLVIDLPADYTLSESRWLYEGVDNEVAVIEVAPADLVAQMFEAQGPWHWTRDGRRVVNEGRVG